MQRARDVIVVVVESKVRPEQAAAALQSAQEGLRRAAQRQTSRRQSRFFQSRIDPSSFLYLGIWESREAFDALFQARQRTEIERSMPQPVLPRYFRILSTFERILMPMEIVVCQMVTGPACASPTLRAAFDGLFLRRNEAGPGLILSQMCEEIGAPGNFVLVSGWRSAEALAAGVAAFGSDFDRTVAAAGATYHRFLGQTRYDSLQTRSTSVSELV
jgi:quinol monooxygenase YgiN